ncbi:nnp-1 protein putative nuclear protein 1 nop52 [Anaeramoeba flamelloides]|uniref:Nnp-1 protein putative nuclear protein 1 nop52 n=1 Tax=Anaeramoeba flamelloides TaxID=1746091 RepID=A0ABQ8Z6W6_9EUKA|nr:nnp-1 protein putative nuclear protein 1 nop52 [Anaeramoeba flamelloides]
MEQKKLQETTIKKNRLLFKRINEIGSTTNNRFNGSSVVFLKNNIPYLIENWFENWRLAKTPSFRRHSIPTKEEKQIIRFRCTAILMDEEQGGDAKISFTDSFLTLSMSQGDAQLPMNDILLEKTHQNGNLLELGFADGVTLSFASPLDAEDFFFCLKQIKLLNRDSQANREFLIALLQTKDPLGVLKQNQIPSKLFSIFITPEETGLFVYFLQYKNTSNDENYLEQLLLMLLNQGYDLNDFNDLAVINESKGTLGEIIKNWKLDELKLKFTKAAQEIQNGLWIEIPKYWLMAAINNQNESFVNQLVESDTRLQAYYNVFELQKETKKSQQIVEQYEKELLQCKKQLNDYGLTLNKKEEESNGFIKRIDQYEKVILPKKDLQIREQQEKIGTLEGEAREQENNANISKQTILILEEEKAQLNHQFKEMVLQKNQIEKSCIAYQQQLNIVQNKNTQYKVTITEIETKKNEEINNLKVEMEKNSHLLISFQNENEKLKLQNMEMQKSLKEKQYELIILNDSYDKLKEENDVNKNNHSQQEQQFKKLINQQKEILDSANQQIEKLRNDGNNLEKNNQNLDKSIRNLEKLIFPTNTLQRKSSLLQTIEKFKKHILILQKTNYEEKKKNVSCENKIIKLQKDIKELKSFNNNKNNNILIQNNNNNNNNIQNNNNTINIQNNNNNIQNNNINIQNTNNINKKNNFNKTQNNHNNRSNSNINEEEDFLKLYPKIQKENILNHIKSNEYILENILQTINYLKYYSQDRKQILENEQWKIKVDSNDQLIINLIKYLYLLFIQGLTNPNHQIIGIINQFVKEINLPQKYMNTDNNTSSNNNNNDNTNRENKFISSDFEESMYLIFHLLKTSQLIPILKNIQQSPEKLKYIYKANSFFLNLICIKKLIQYLEVISIFKIVNPLQMEKIEKDQYFNSFQTKDLIPKLINKNSENYKLKKTVKSIVKYFKTQNLKNIQIYIGNEQKNKKLFNLITNRLCEIIETSLKNHINSNSDNAPCDPWEIFIQFYKKNQSSEIVHSVLQHNIKYLHKLYNVQNLDNDKDKLIGLIRWGLNQKLLHHFFLILANNINTFKPLLACNELMFHEQLKNISTILTPLSELEFDTPINFKL